MSIDSSNPEPSDSTSDVWGSVFLNFPILALTGVYCKVLQVAANYCKLLVAGEEFENRASLVLQQIISSRQSVTFLCSAQKKKQKKRSTSQIDLPESLPRLSGRLVFVERHCPMLRIEKRKKNARQVRMTCRNRRNV